MNDSINQPKKLYEEIKDKVNVVIMSPNERQDLSNLKQNLTSIDIWDKKYKQIENYTTEQFSNSINFNDLNREYHVYKQKIFKLNSKILIFIASKIKFLKFFQPINIFLIDHKKNYEFSLINGLKIAEDKIPDIKMHSESLQFIFKNDFGFDTLTVNGCFESTKDGFIKSTKSFAIGTLNSMGLKLNLKLLFNFKLILFFLNLIKKVSKKI